LLVQVLILLVSDSEFEVPRAALRERYSSPVTSTSDPTSALPSQPTTPRLALFSIPSPPPLQSAKPPSTIASEVCVFIFIFLLVIVLPGGNLT